MNFIGLIWAGIWRKRTRTLLALLQITVAFVLFGLLQGMKSGVDDTAKRIRADLFIVQRAAGRQPLPIAMYDRIEKIPGVVAATYLSYLGGTYQQPTQRVTAIAADLTQKLAPVAITAGVAITPAALSAMQKTRDAVLVSDSLAREYGWKNGDRIPLETQTPREDGSSTWTFDVVGTVTPGAQALSHDFLVMNYAYLDEARRLDKGTVQEFYFQILDPGQASSVASAVDGAFANSSNETRTDSYREWIQSSLQSLGNFDFAIHAIVGTVFCALLLSIGATMMLSIQERTREFAILKTLGFRDALIFWIIQTEALCTCVVSALLGLSLALWMMPMSRHIINIEVSMPQTVVVVGMGAAVILAMVTTTIPAIRAQRLQISEALSEVGGGSR